MKNNNMVMILLSICMVHGLSSMDFFTNNPRMIVNWLTDEGMTPLLLAVRNLDDYDMVLLVEQGVDINIPSNIGSTALLIAVNNDSFDTVEFLLNCGADINIMNNNHHSPLSLSVDKDNIDIIRLLLQYSNLDFIDENPMRILLDTDQINTAIQRLLFIADRTEVQNQILQILMDAIYPDFK